MGSTAVSDDEQRAQEIGLARDAAKAAERVGLKADGIVIRGGKPLRGRVDVRGAKNLATKAMVAALLGRTPSILQDVPQISEISLASAMLTSRNVFSASLDISAVRLSETNSVPRTIVW